METRVSGNKELQDASLLLNKKKTPNKTVKYALTAGYQNIYNCLYLKCHYTLRQQNVGLLIIAEKLDCCNNLGKTVGEENEDGKGKGEGGVHMSKDRVMANNNK